MIRALVAFAALPALLIPSGGASAEHHEAAAAELPPWNQEEVASLARELQKTVHELRRLERNMPHDTIASGQSRAREQYRQLLRGLDIESRSLADQVAKGKSREETRNLYRRIEELSRDAAEEARRMFLPQRTIDEIQKAEDLTNRLRVAYRGAPDPRPTLVGPSKGEGAKKKR